LSSQKEAVIKHCRWSQQSTSGDKKMFYWQRQSRLPTSEIQRGRGRGRLSVWYVVEGVLDLK